MEDDYFSISKLLKTIESKKTRSDFKKTDIFENLLEIDKQSIIGDKCKNKYYRTVLYWAEPTFAVFIENNEDFKKFVIYTTIGSIPWTLAFVSAGYFLGDNWEIVSSYIDILKLPIIIFIIIFIAIYIFKRIFKNKIIYINTKGSN